MSVRENSVLLIGESSAGKTHYGAQLLMRLNHNGNDNRSRGLRMDGAATNLAPFEEAMRCLNQGKAAGHTAKTTYAESVWPIADNRGRKANLLWPDYGGEQICNMIESRQILDAWRQRVLTASSWLFLIRLTNTKTADDLMSRPLSDLKNTSVESGNLRISDQARAIELLQMLLYVRGVERDGRREMPRLGVLLTCWDELTEQGRPEEMLSRHLPMVADFVLSNWTDPFILGLSALGRHLSPDTADEEFVAQGPERHGYVVQPDGAQTSDLTLPIQMSMADVS